MTWESGTSHATSALLLTACVTPGLLLPFSGSQFTLDVQWRPWMDKDLSHLLTQRALPLNPLNPCHRVPVTLSRWLPPSLLHPPSGFVKHVGPR